MGQVGVPPETTEIGLSVCAKRARAKRNACISAPEAACITPHRDGKHYIVQVPWPLHLAGTIASRIVPVRCFAMRLVLAGCAVVRLQRAATPRRGKSGPGRAGGGPDNGIMGAGDSGVDDCKVPQERADIGASRMMTSFTPQSLIWLSVSANQETATTVTACWLADWQATAL